MLTKVILILSVILAATADEFEEFDDQYESSKTNPPKINYENQYEPKNEYHTKSEYNNNNKKPHNIEYENQYESKNEYHAKSGYKPTRVLCLDVDVTTKCLNKDDGNYAIDNKPRSGYIACVNKSPICMPCPYGLVFCANTGYNNLGQCLGPYDECPPRTY